MKHFFIKQSKELQIEELYEKCGDHSLKLLFGLYRGSYGYLFLSLLFYVIKHSPAWILPIITAKVVDIAASGNQAEYGMIVWYLLFMAVMTIQNLPTSHLHVHFRSLAIRQIEAELRGALVRKLQHLSILYHKQMSSGRLQSKIMRDVEAVENLSTQMFIQMVSILLSIGIALTVTLAHSRIVFIMVPGDDSIVCGSSISFPQTDEGDEPAVPTGSGAYLWSCDGDDGTDPDHQSPRPGRRRDPENDRLSGACGRKWLSSGCGPEPVWRDRLGDFPGFPVGVLRIYFLSGNPGKK